MRQDMIVILDLGSEENPRLAREIRALDRPDATTLPIIAETADAFEEGQRRARDAGMTALTTKPLNIHELVALLAEYIPEK